MVAVVDVAVAVLDVFVLVAVVAGVAMVRWMSCGKLQLLSCCVGMGRARAGICALRNSVRDAVPLSAGLKSLLDRRTEKGRP